jgi:murein DD-endopeptidase MepM/ murein hydrolase activator NlpD
MAPVRGYVRRWLAASATGSLVLVVSLCVQLAGVARSDAAGTFAWPVTGPVIRGFEGPATPYSAGHRGIDIAAEVGTPIQAPDAGVVTFAGRVAGSLFLTIDHGAGIRTSYSLLSGLAVSKGAIVSRGQLVAFTGHGHPDVDVPHLHFGIRLNGVYVDPLDYLEPASVVDLIRLAPLSEPTPGPAAVLGMFGATVAGWIWPR